MGEGFRGRLGYEGVEYSKIVIVETGENNGYLNDKRWIPECVHSLVDSTTWTVLCVAVVEVQTSTVQHVDYTTIPGPLVVSSAVSTTCIS